APPSQDPLAAARGLARRPESNPQTAALYAVLAYRLERSGGGSVDDPVVHEALRQALGRLGRLEEAPAAASSQDLARALCRHVPRDLTPGERLRTGHTDSPLPRVCPFSRP